MQISRKTKISSVAAPETSTINPKLIGTKFMDYDTSLVNKSQLTMSSREIASLTNKRHDNICRDIRAILITLLGGEDADYVYNSNLSYLTNQHVSCNQYDSKNPNAWEYHISRHYIEILITDYNIKRRTAVIDRLYELEEAKALTNNKKKMVLPKHTGLAEYRKARVISMATKSAEVVCNRFDNLSKLSQQVIFAKMVNSSVNEELIPNPILKNKTFSASEVSDLLGISSNMIGRIANKLNLKTEGYGIFVLDKSRSSDKQVETFRYNEKAIDVIKAHLINKETA